MSYVDAIHLKDKIHVVERIAGERVHRIYPAKYTFYFDDQNGDHKTIYGGRVKQFTSTSKKEFMSEKARTTGKTWESDVKPLNRCLEENYLNQLGPELHIAFFDIEVDFDPKIGFSSPDDPFTPITAITVYLSWVDELITVAIPPKEMSMDVATELVKDFDNTFLFETEEALLESFLDIIDDADVLSGWNSEGFDIPYCVNRITKVLSRADTARMCLWDQLPKRREFERYGAAQTTYDLFGRIHLDYMQLYRKYTYHEMHSYSLDAIGEYEVGETKIAYEGTLDQLYHNDFKTFIEYNRQDTYLLYKIDKKLQFIDLANSIAHENTVLIPVVMGAVAVTEQAIINESHRLGKMVMNKVRYGEDDQTQAAGAYVAKPKRGLHKWIGSIDINSLYPSTIRALNMSPETVVGQVRQDATNKMIKDYVRAAVAHTFAGAWEGKFGSLEYEWIMEKNPDKTVIIDWEDGRSDELSAADAYKLIFESEQPWTFSTNGTIFTREKEGIIPGLLARWYKERQELQAIKKHWIKFSDGMKLGAKKALDVIGKEMGITNLNDILDDEKALSDFDLYTKDGKLFHQNKDYVQKRIEFWDKRQLVKKINLNSLYGAILNQHCRFFDQRIGQSTTLTGRAIAKHMSAYVNECLAGKYDHRGETIIYGDTDSVYFSAWPVIKDDVEQGKLEWDKDICTSLYESISAEVNESFPGFMRRACNCPTEYGKIIRGGREISAISGLFITKKRYACLVYDKEGKRQDVNGKPGSLKAMGLDLKRADTPEFVQDFLKEILMDALSGSGKEEITQKIIDFKHKVYKMKSWEKGSPKRVNNMTRYSRKLNKNIKAPVPGHVRAGYNWNKLKEMNGDNYSMSITDGQKCIVCRLRPTPLGIDSVAIPIDEKHIPQWFKELPFDDERMEDTIIDKKIDNLFGILGWDLDMTTDIRTSFNTLFSFGP